MKAFNDKLQQYSDLVLENPENYGGGMDSPDVVTFVLMLNPEGIVFSTVGLEISHAKILSFIKLEHIPPYMNSYGEFDVSKITPDNILTGRVWLNSEKIGLWEYVEDQLVDDKYVRKITEKILNLLRKNHQININNYSIEVTPVYNQNQEERELSLST
jgi:hypothetical protein